MKRQWQKPSVRQKLNSVFTTLKNTLKTIEELAKIHCLIVLAYKVVFLYKTNAIFNMHFNAKTNVIGILGQNVTSNVIGFLGQRKYHVTA